MVVKKTGRLAAHLGKLTTFDIVGKAIFWHFAQSPKWILRSAK